MKHIVLAPHLDDEVIGCYSIWDKIDTVIFYTNDYRAIGLVQNLRDYKKQIDKINTPVVFNVPNFVHSKNFDFESITNEDIIYLPSKFDFHPLHKVVRNFGLALPAFKMFYSVEMNVPWLEEEKDSKGKLELLKFLYPGEDLFLINAKYYLFNSIKEYDNISYKRIYSSFSLDYKLYIQEFSAFESFKEIEIKVQELKKKISYSRDLMYFYNLLQNAFPNRLIKIITNEKIIE